MVTCTCVTCSICGGTGTIRIPDLVLGPGYDDLDMCDNCDSGIVEECDYCLDQRERDEDARA
jgi:hypothetical protein